MSGFWKTPKVSEREVVEAFERASQLAARAGVPATFCVIRASEERIVKTVVRESKETPGIPSVEDRSYLASTVLVDCTRNLPDDARKMMVGVIVEFADQMRYRQEGGTIPPHMIASDNPPPILEGNEPVE